MNKNKGFTLIELLVVIAIIGILASVVLASLSSARDKGKDAAVKSQLSSMRAQAELFYSAADTYASICTTVASSNGFGGDGGPGLLKATKDSETMDVGTVVTDTSAGAYNRITCHSTIDYWAVEAPLTNSASGASIMFCVDSSGTSKTSTGTTATANLEAITGGTSIVGVTCR